MCFAEGHLLPSVLTVLYFKWQLHIRVYVSLHMVLLTTSSALALCCGRDVYLAAIRTSVDILPFFPFSNTPSFPLPVPPFSCLPPSEKLSSNPAARCLIR